MLQQPFPALIKQPDGTYACAEIRVLYQWLMAQGYQALGCFESDEYARFGWPVAAQVGGRAISPQACLRILVSGMVLPLEEQAVQMLDGLIPRV